MVVVHYITPPKVYVYGYACNGAVSIYVPKMHSKHSLKHSGFYMPHLFWFSPQGVCVGFLWFLNSIYFPK
jgi:hypothetical protein